LNIDVFNAATGSAFEVGIAISHTVFHKNFLPVSLAYDTSVGAVVRYGQRHSSPRIRWQYCHSSGSHSDGGFTTCQVPLKVG
jgi:hypothetical protein